MIDKEGDDVPSQEDFMTAIHEAAKLLPEDVQKLSATMSYRAVLVTNFLMNHGFKDEIVDITRSVNLALFDVFGTALDLIERYKDCPDEIAPILFTIYSVNQERAREELAAMRQKLDIA